MAEQPPHGAEGGRFGREPAALLLKHKGQAVSNNQPDIVQSAMEEPRQAMADGVSTTAHTLTDLIKADQYTAAKRAAGKPHRGLRFNKLIPPGTIGDS